MRSTKRFWTGCIVTLALNSALLFSTSYAENHWFERTLIITFLIYCFFLAAFSVVFVKKSIWDGFITLFTLLATGLAGSFLFFVILGSIHDDTIAFAFLAIGITGLNALLLHRCFWVILSLRIFIETGIVTIIGIALLAIPKSVTDHYYGFSLMLSLWSLIITVLALRHSLGIRRKYLS